MSRELDAEIAEKVMGWTRLSQWTWNNEGGVTWRWRLQSPEMTEILLRDYPGDYVVAEQGHVPFNIALAIVPHYSEDMAAAWEVVEELQERGLAMQLTFGVYTWECVFGDTEKAYGEARNPSAPEAICLAALKTVDRGQTPLKPLKEEETDE